MPTHLATKIYNTLSISVVSTSTTISISITTANCGCSNTDYCTSVIYVTLGFGSNNTKTSEWNPPTNRGNLGPYSRIIFSRLNILWFRIYGLKQSNYSCWLLSAKNGRAGKTLCILDLRHVFVTIVLIRKQFFSIWFRIWNQRSTYSKLRISYSKYLEHRVLNWCDILWLIDFLQIRNCNSSCSS